MDDPEFVVLGEQTVPLTLCENVDGSRIPDLGVVRRQPVLVVV